MNTHEYPQLLAIAVSEADGNALARAIHGALLARAGSAILTAATVALAMPAISAHAANIVVDAGAIDDDGSNGNCSLVDAVRAANTDSAIDACVAGIGADTLLIPSGSVFSFDNPHDASDGVNALPSITSEITLEGNTAVIERSDTAGTPDFRLLHVAVSGKLTIRVATLHNGSAVGSASGGFGGAIFNQGELRLETCWIDGNTAESTGGGIHNAGDLELQRSTVSGNWADTGGGVFTAAKSTTTLDNSTFHDNYVFDKGGGIYSKGAVTLNQTTVSNNIAWREGGGIHASDDMTLNRSTVTDNLADFAYNGSYGGGIAALYSAHLTLNHSIVSGNSAYLGHEIDAQVVSVNNYNLFGHDQLSIYQGLLGFAPGPTDINAFFKGTTPTAEDDILDPSLVNHGGPTPTRALAPGSPAIDAGDPGFTPPPDHDQRGPPFDRVVGSAVDMGAFEHQFRIFVDRFEQ